MSSVFANINAGSIVAGLAAVVALVVGIHLSAALAGVARVKAGSESTFGRSLVATLVGTFAGVALTVGFGILLGEFQAQLALAASVPGLWASYRIARGLVESRVAADEIVSLDVETVEVCCAYAVVEEECSLPTA